MSGSRQRPPTTIAGPTAAGERGQTLLVDPRAVRVGVAPATRLEGDPAFSLAPSSAAPSGEGLLVDGVAIRAHLRRLDAVRARLEQHGSDGSHSTDVLFGGLRGPTAGNAGPRSGRGWLAHRGRDRAGAAGGPARARPPGRRGRLEGRARRGPGDHSRAGRGHLRGLGRRRRGRPADPRGGGHEDAERAAAPREGSVERVGVAVGATIEVGDLLVVIR
jgi:hypothetical protein